MKKQDYSSIIRSMEIEDFIRVPAPDTIGCFWYDERGHNTEDEDEVVRKKEMLIPQTRFAENSEDYEFILNREAEKKKQDRNDYVEIFIEDLKLKLTKNVSEYGELNIDLTDRRIRVRKLIKYLENRVTHTEDTFNRFIFTSELGQKIFSEWYEVKKGLEREKPIKADFDFIYWALKDDGFLTDAVNQTVFSKWLPEWNDRLIFGRIESKDKKPHSTKKQKSYELIKASLK